MPVDVFTDEFARMAAEATSRARSELLANGIDVVHFDRDAGIDVLERPDGRRFEIRYLQQGDPNYEIVSELPNRRAT